MRLEHARIEHFVVAEPRLAHNLRLQGELNEILGSLSLDNEFRPLFVNGDG